VARSPLTRLGITVSAGLLLWASFAPLNWWWTAIAAFAQFAWVLTNPAMTLLGGAGHGLVFGLAFYLPLVRWAGAFAGPLAWLGLALLVAAFTPFFGVAAVAVRSLPGWPVWFATLWPVSEWLRSWVPFGGVPWGGVATGQTHGPLLPLVRLGGTPLLSAAVVLAGCSLTAIVAALAVRRRPDAETDSSDTGAPRTPVLAGVCLGALVAVAAVAWPLARHAATADGPSVTVAAVQGNVPRMGHDFNSQRRAVLDYHVRETIRLAEDVEAGAAPRPSFVVWPENSSDIDPLLNWDAGRQIGVAAKAIGAPILVGSLLTIPGTDADWPGYTNTVIVWDPETGPGERHNKQFVQPFGEYLPLPGLFTHLTPHGRGYGHIDAGQSTGVVHAAGVAVGVGTCWEVTFDQALRQSVNNGAQMLVVPANNATFGKLMSEQELAFSKVRAVELDRFVVVASTTGISAVIAPDGRELARTGYFTPAYLDTSVGLKTHLTPAARWGAQVQWILIFLGAAAVFAATAGRRWLRPRPGGTA
jgi:apolipoprotein N-acyltransferase